MSMSFCLEREGSACASRVRFYRISPSPETPSARIVPDTIGKMLHDGGHLSAYCPHRAGGLEHTILSACRSVAQSVQAVWGEMPGRFLSYGEWQGPSGRLYRRGPDPWASWPRQPASAYHCDPRWRDCASPQGGAF